MEFSYKLTGTGWGEATITDDSTQVVLRTSYLSDVLSELLSAVGSLLQGASHAECSWLEEPGEWRWMFDQDDGQISLRILGFDDGWFPQPEDQGTVVFETADSVRDLSTAIVRGVEAVLDEYGEQGYERRWVEHPFPTYALDLVKEQLAS